MGIKVLILAGGRSERFWPLSDKNLFSFLGKPLIAHQIERVKGAGFKRIIVVANQENLGVIKNFGVRVVLQKGEGQAAAILSARNFLKGPVLVINANDIFETSLLRKVLKVGQKKDVDACLVGYKTNSYFPGGYLLADKRGEVKKIVEKPGKGKEPSNLIRLVVDFFKKGERLFLYLKKEILYEEAINLMIKDGALVRMIPYKGEWGFLKYPWHTLKVMDFFLNRIRDSKIDKSAQIAKSTIIQGNKVVLEKGVRVFENAKIVGPCYIGQDTIIGNNVIIRQSMISKNCVIGFSTEITRSYIGENCWLHSNYVGDSVLDKNVSLGAGTVLANLRLDEGNISSIVRGEKIDTQKTKLGAIIGQNVRIGVNASIMPGVKLGKNSFIGAGVVLEKDLAKDKFCLRKENLRVMKNIKRTEERGRENFRRRIPKS